MERCPKRWCEIRLSDYGGAGRTAPRYGGVLGGRPVLSSLAALPTARGSPDPREDAPGTTPCGTQCTQPSSRSTASTPGRVLSVTAPRDGARSPPTWADGVTVAGLTTRSRLVGQSMTGSWRYRWNDRRKKTRAVGSRQGRPEFFPCPTLFPFPPWHLWTRNIWYCYSASIIQMLEGRERIFPVEAIPCDIPEDARSLLRCPFGVVRKNLLSVAISI